MEQATSVKSGHVALSPPALSRLLTAAGVGHEEAWETFVAEYSGVILHVCHQVEPGHDAVMDGYTAVLDALRENDCRRLRSYTPVTGARFTTWLVVVVRRLLLDRRRHRYGRIRGDDAAARNEREVRRRLEDLVVAELDADQLPDARGSDADGALRREEQRRAVHAALRELPASDRLLLALRFEDERSAREIAPLVGLPTAFHVYRRLAAVLSSLKGALARRGVDGAEP